MERLKTKYINYPGHMVEHSRLKNTTVCNCWILGKSFMAWQSISSTKIGIVSLMFNQHKIIARFRIKK